MILQNVRQLVRAKLDDMQFDASKVDSAINWFIFELLNNNRISFMEDSTNIPFNQGDTEVSLPADYQVGTNIIVTISGVEAYNIWKNRVEYVDFMSRFPGFSVATQQRIREWTFYGKKIRFSGPSIESGNLFVDYVKRPVKATGDNDVLVIPDNYEEMVVIGATARVMEMNEDYAEAAQERQNNEPLVTAFIRNEARGQQQAGPLVIRTNRRGRDRDW